MNISKIQWRMDSKLKALTGLYINMEDGILASFLIFCILSILQIPIIAVHHFFVAGTFRAHLKTWNLHSFYQVQRHYAVHG